MTTTPPCTCGRIALGLEVTEVRNWNPECPKHGTSSAWWNSTEQRAAREERRVHLTDLQRRAREARQQARYHADAEENPPMTTTPPTDQQLADTCGTCHGRDFKRCPACLGTGIKPNPLAWMRFWRLLDEMEPARLRYRRALRRAEATSTDSPEFDAARVKGDAALAEIEQLMRGWIAANPAANGIAANEHPVASPSA